MYCQCIAKAYMHSWEYLFRAKLLKISNSYSNSKAMQCFRIARCIKLLSFGLFKMTYYCMMNYSDESIVFLETKWLKQSVYKLRFM